MNVAFVVIALGGPGEHVTPADLQATVEAVAPFRAYPLTDPILVGKVAERIMADNLARPLAQKET
jgi:hypothetical protein